MSKKSDRKLKVIQIGIGGYSSSGKTVLIDALFSLFTHSCRPGYMPSSFKGGLYNLSGRFDGVYDQSSELRLMVSRQFHADNATSDSGKWNENTYCGKLSIGKDQMILLVRNLPGEMFNQYFDDLNPGNVSPRVLFKQFIDQNHEYEQIYKDLFRFNIAASANNTKGYIAGKIDEMRDKFIAEKLQFVTEQTTIKSLSDNFYAFLFYASSDFNIYCIKPNDPETPNPANKVFVDNAFLHLNPDDDEHLKKFILCYTQFDKILVGTDLPTPPVSNGYVPAIKQKWYIKLFWRILGKPMPVKTFDEENELTKYLLSMNELYKDLKSAQPKYVELAAWNDLKKNGWNNSGKMKWFIASVAYNYEKRRFFQFSNAADNLPNIWNKENSHDRTAIGVLELALYMLLQSGVKLSDSSIQIPREENFDYINAKVNVIKN